MPTNETGYTVTVGPDTEGRYIEVPPGEDYDLPALPPFIDPDTGNPGDPPAEAAPVDEGYDSLKVAELRSLLAERGLEQDGIKAELVARLTEHDAGDAGGDGPETADTNGSDNPEGASS